MSSFKLAFHGTSGRRIVEVWEGELFVAAIYPDTDEPAAFKIISKYPVEVTPFEDDLLALNVLNVKVSPS